VTGSRGERILVAFKLLYNASQIRQVGEFTAPVLLRRGFEATGFGSLSEEKIREYINALYRGVHDRHGTIYRIYLKRTRVDEPGKYHILIKYDANEKWIDWWIPTVGRTGIMNRITKDCPWIKFKEKSHGN